MFKRAGGFLLLLSIASLVSCGQQPKPSSLFKEDVVQFESSQVGSNLVAKKPLTQPLDSTLMSIKNPPSHPTVVVPKQGEPINTGADVFKMRVRVFPLFMDIRGEPYPVTKNQNELELSNTADLEVFDVVTTSFLLVTTSNTADLEVFDVVTSKKLVSGQRLHFALKEQSLSVYKLGKDTEPSETIKFKAILIKPADNITPTLVHWNKGIIEANESKEVEITYRGSFVFDLSSDELVNNKYALPYTGGKPYWALVNHVSLEDYVNSVVPSEMPPGFSAMAFQAQAIAARTFAVRHTMISGNTNKIWDVDPTTSYQSYRGTKLERSKITKAIEGVHGQVIVYKNEIIDASFHSNSGGLTCPAQECFSTKSAYRVSVVDHPGVRLVKDITAGWSGKTNLNVVRAFLKSKKIDFSQFDMIAPTKISATNRVHKIDVVLKDGKRVLIGDTGRGSVQAFMTGYNSNMLEFSQSSDPNDEAGVQNIVGYGFGHGVGMSQWGANLFSREKDMTYNKILKYYYKDITIEMLEGLPAPAPKKVP